MHMAKSKRKPKLTPEQKLQRKQKNEIRTILNNIGFVRITGIEGKQFIYNHGDFSRKSELDDLFILENVILFVEYTVGHYESHLAKKNLLYREVFNSPQDFYSFLLNEQRFDSLRKYHEEVLSKKYNSLSQLQFRILYCSLEDVSPEYKSCVTPITYFDGYIVNFFKCFSAALKHSARFEFLDFLGIQIEQFGENMLKTGQSIQKVKAYVLPSVRTSLKDGYKILTFYMEPSAILRRAYVLRHEGWREKSSSVYYQRMAEASRIRAIRKFLAEESRVFVNNIIVTISEKDVSFMDLEGRPIKLNERGRDSERENNATIVEMTIADKGNTIGLIDGQHRVFAYHEDDDEYEPKISSLRNVQNLLVTGILFPKEESEEVRRKFEAVLFKEINVKQTKINTYLQQELDLIVAPFSMTSIGKIIIRKLNSSGPLCNMLEVLSYEKGKIKSSSIVSYGLKPLVKLSESDDSLYKLWQHNDKALLLDAEANNAYAIRDEYIDYCVEKIRDLLIAVKDVLPNEDWQLYNHATKRGYLSITFINGLLNLIRFIIRDGSLFTIEEYRNKLQGLSSFPFRTYTSSHYKQMGEAIYNRFFKIDK